MRKLFLRTFLLLFVIFCAFHNAYCQNKQPRTPQELDNYFCSVSDTIVKYAIEWTASLKKNEYSKLPALRNRLVNFIDIELNRHRNLSDVDGSEKYRLAAINVLKFEKQLINSAYTPFEPLANSFSEEKKDSLVNFLIKECQKEVEHAKQLDDERRKYLKKHNIPYIDK